MYCAFVVYVEPRDAGRRCPCSACGSRNSTSSLAKSAGMCGAIVGVAGLLLLVGQLADRHLSARVCLSVCALLAGVFFWILADLTSPFSVFMTALAIWLMLGPANMLCATLCFAHLPQPENSYGPVRLWGTMGWVAAGWLVGLWFWLQMTLFDSASDLGDIFRWAAVMAFARSAYGLTLPRS